MVVDLPARLFCLTVNLLLVFSLWMYSTTVFLFFIMIMCLECFVNICVVYFLCLCDECQDTLVFIPLKDENYYVCGAEITFKSFFTNIYTLENYTAFNLVSLTL